MNRCRVLIADHDEAHSEVCSFYLRNRVYQIATPDDGNRAIDMGWSGNFEIVILDLALPVYEGVEVLRLLRRRHLLHPPKIVIVATNATVEIRHNLDYIGIDGFLTKPVTPDFLANELARLTVTQTVHRSALLRRRLQTQLHREPDAWARDSRDGPPLTAATLRGASFEGA